MIMLSQEKIWKDSYEYVRIRQALGEDLDWDTVRAAYCQGSLDAIEKLENEAYDMCDRTLNESKNK